jgi:phosphoglycolate phosphatase
MVEKKLIIFDFDGVLVNTIDLSYSIHNKTNPSLTREQFDHLSLGNFLENYEREIAEGRLLRPGDFFEEYNAGILNLSTHDIIDVLIVDLAQKYELVICSSMDSVNIKQKLKKENILHHFSEILGMEVAYSKIVKINKILKDRNMPPSCAIFITDTIGDIHEGRECGVQSIGVSWGNHSRERLLSVNPYAVVDTVQELEQTIEKYFLEPRT